MRESGRSAAAGELAQAGIEVAIVERRVRGGPARHTGGGLHAQTIEVLDQRGIADASTREAVVVLPDEPDQAAARVRRGVWPVHAWNAR